MIRIEELRIGNKVYFPEKQTEWEVSMLEENGVGLKKLHSINTYYYEFAKLKNIEPIEITDKHLIGLGFEKIRHDKFKDAYLNKDLSIEVLLSNVNKTDNMVFKGSEILKLDLKLHQLQNLITLLK